MWEIHLVFENDDDYDGNEDLLQTCNCLRANNVRPTG